MKKLQTKKLALIALISSTLHLSAHANIDQGISAYDANNLQQAKELLLKESDSDFNKHLYLAKIAIKNNQLDDAENYIEEAAELNATSGDAQFFSDMGMQALAQEKLRLCCQMNSIYCF